MYDIFRHVEISLVLLSFQILEDWRYIAMVIDRLQLYIFLAVTIGGTVGILINAPHIFQYVDQAQIIDALKDSQNGELNY